MDPENLLERRFSKIAVDEKYPFSGFRHGCGDIGGVERLPFRRDRTRYDINKSLILFVDKAVLEIDAGRTEMFG